MAISCDKDGIRKKLHTSTVYSFWHVYKSDTTSDPTEWVESPILGDLKVLSALLSSFELPSEIF